jgi:hypothetical protein
MEWSLARDHSCIEREAMHEAMRWHLHMFKHNTLAASRLIVLETRYRFWEHPNNKRRTPFCRYDIARSPFSTIITGPPLPSFPHSIRYFPTIRDPSSFIQHLSEVEVPLPVPNWAIGIGSFTFSNTCTTIFQH